MSVIWQDSFVVFQDDFVLWAPHGILSASISDTITISEAIVIHSIRSVSISDTITISEAIATHGITTVSISDTVTISESIAIHSIRSVSISDTVTISEAITASLLSVNDFSQDASCVALYRFEDGAIGADSKGTDTLAVYEVTPDTSDYKERYSSAVFVAANYSNLYRGDSLLSQNFPLKSGISNQTFSFCLHAKFTSITTDTQLFSKNDDVSKCIIGRLGISPAVLVVTVSTNGTSWINLAHSSILSADTWYHIAFTKSALDDSWRIRIHNDAGVVGVDATGTVGDLNLNTGPFILGYLQSPASLFDGKLDEFVIFNKVLTVAEIDQIWSGTYATAALATSVHDSITVSESLARVIPLQFAAIVDAITITESVEAIRSVLLASISDSVVVNDAVEPLIPVLFASTSDSVTVAEDLSVVHLHVNENDFTQDVNCIAHYRFEPGALGVDSIGTDTLSHTAVTANITDYKEGVSSAQLTKAGYSDLWRTDANLSANFPLKSGTANQTFSVCFWTKFTDEDTSQNLIAKGADVDRCLIALRTVANIIRFYASMNGTDWTYLNHASTLSQDVWYHIAFTKDGSTDEWRIRIHDFAGVVGVDATGTIGDLNLNTATLAFGYLLDGLLDEAVIFNRALSVAAIDLVWEGLFGTVQLADLSDAVTVSESITAVLPQLSATLVDTVAVSELLLTPFMLFNELSESITIAESISGTLDKLHQSLSDAITISESVETYIGVAADISDAIVVTDNLVAQFRFNVDAYDSLTVNDIVVTATVTSVAISDTISVTDALIVLPLTTLQGSVSDSVTVLESLTPALLLVQGYSDSISVTENLEAHTVFGSSVVDTVTVIDIADMKGGLSATIWDSVTVSEAVVNFTTLLHGSLSDTITVSESLVAYPPVLIVLCTDTITVAEHLYRSQLAIVKLIVSRAYIQPIFLQDTRMNAKYTKSKHTLFA